MSTDEPFLSRWSRRKVEARKGEPVAEPAPPASDLDAGAAKAEALPARTTDAAIASAPPSDAQGSASPAELPAVDTLEGLKSEYTDFLRPGVDESTKRTALKKLFADPHFNQMDGLDVYIDDYGRFEAMPAAVAASLQAAKHLSVFDHLASEQRVARSEAAAGVAAERPADDGTVASAEAAAPTALPANAATAESNATPAPDAADARSLEDAPTHVARREDAQDL
jgi:hypothetical protein